MQLIIWVVLTVISYLLTPKPAKPTAPVPGEMDVPTVDSASPVGVLFGTRLMQGPNCVVFTDVGTTPIVACSGGKK